jgi:hypothetical protein
LVHHPFKAADPRAASAAAPRAAAALQSPCRSRGVAGQQRRSVMAKGQMRSTQHPWSDDRFQRVLWRKHADHTNQSKSLPVHRILVHWPFGEHQLDGLDLPLSERSRLLGCRRYIGCCYPSWCPRSYRRCGTAWPDLGGRWSSRLVATACAGAFFGQPAKCDVAHTSLSNPPPKVR